MARQIAIFGLVFLALLFAGATPARAEIPFAQMARDHAPQASLPFDRGGGSSGLHSRDKPSEREVMSAIWTASQQTGVDFHYLLANAELESGLDPSAKASTSSAAGLFQFIETTWLTSLDRYERQSSETEGYSRKDRLAWRFDPHISSRVAAAFAMDNAKALEARLGRSASNAELYLAHFLGSGAASQFLAAMQRNPHMAGARLFPKAATANRPVFFTRTGRSKSLREILSHFELKLSNAISKFERQAPELTRTHSIADLFVFYQRFEKDSSLQIEVLATDLMVDDSALPYGANSQSLKSNLSSRVQSNTVYLSDRFKNHHPKISLTYPHSPMRHSASDRAQAPISNNRPACDHIEMCYTVAMSTSTITQIRNLVDSGAYTKAGIARAAGLHANTLRDANEADWNPTADTLAKLQKFLDANDDTPVLVGIEEIIDEARNGRMYILVDDEDRENEGDLIIPAQMATPSAINFMATHGRGLICLALDKARVEQLELHPMSRNNKESMQTAFTVSIEAKEGVTTGISAADRARTVSVAIDATKGPDDIVTPGHVFPLMARDGGTLVRAGHTEAAVDISRLAGLNPSGVICEIMNEDGTMARLDDLVDFARQHKLKIGTIRDLIAYRMRHDHLVERIDERSFESDFGGQWRLITYRNTVSDDEAYVLQKGHVIPGEPTLARVHPISLFNDILGAPGPRQNTLQRAMRAIGEHGSGVIAILTQRVGASGEWSRDEVHRNVGIGSQILADLGIEDMVLLTNSQPDYVALDGYGLSITDTKPIPE